MFNARNVRAEPTIAYFDRDIGTWQGAGASYLNLEGAVDPQEFACLMRGREPDLQQKIFDSRVTRAGIDGVFSAPKSVSIAALVRQEGAVAIAHHDAVARALDFVEERYSRVKVKGRVELSQNLIVAKFIHTENRNLDPHLHTHCILINASRYQGKWRALRNDGIYFNSGLIGLVYQQHLAFNLQKCGYQIRFDSKGYIEIASIDPREIAEFSTRKNQIIALAKGTSWQERQSALIRTRNTKINSAPLYTINSEATSPTSAAVPVPVGKETFDLAFTECLNRYFKFEREQLEKRILENIGRTCDLNSVFALTQNIQPKNWWEERKAILQKAIASPVPPLTHRTSLAPDILAQTLTSDRRCIVWQGGSEKHKQQVIDYLCRQMPRRVAVIDPENLNSHNPARLWVVQRAERLTADKLVDLIRSAVRQGAKILFLSRNLPSQLKHLQSGMLTLNCQDRDLIGRLDRARPIKAYLLK